MSMGSLNMKLMQGIEEAENQMQKEKQTQKVGKQEKVENETRDATLYLAPFIMK